MTSDQARFLFEFLLPQLESEHSVTRRILSSVPREKGEYRTHPQSRSAFQIARHIAVCEIWFLDAIIEGWFGEATISEDVATCEQVVEWYVENFTRRTLILKTLSSENLAKSIDYLGLRNDPAVAYLNIAIRHSVHHRGQLTAYLRSMGARVPAIYVESGDEPFDGNVLPGQQPPPAF